VEKAFCTVVNCMDGRVQLPVISYLQKRFGAEYVDSITEPGPIKALSEDQGGPTAGSVLDRIAISVEKHGSCAIAVVGHHDCAGNPQPKETQLHQIEKAVELISSRFPNAEVIGLWVDGSWQVSEVR